MNENARAERAENESFAAYRLRRAAMQHFEKASRHGKMVWASKAVFVQKKDGQTIFYKKTLRGTLKTEHKRLGKAAKKAAKRASRDRRMVDRWLASEAVESAEMLPLVVD